MRVFTIYVVDKLKMQLCSKLMAPHKPSEGSGDEKLQCTSQSTKIQKLAQEISKNKVFSTEILPPSI